MNKTQPRWISALNGRMKLSIYQLPCEIHISHSVILITVTDSGIGKLVSSRITQDKMSVLICNNVGFTDYTVQLGTVHCERCQTVNTIFPICVLSSIISCAL